MHARITYIIVAPSALVMCVLYALDLNPRTQLCVQDFLWCARVHRSHDINLYREASAARLASFVKISTTQAQRKHLKGGQATSRQSYLDGHTHRPVSLYLRYTKEWPGLQIWSGHGLGSLGCSTGHATV